MRPQIVLLLVASGLVADSLAPPTAAAQSANTPSSRAGLFFQAIAAAGLRTWLEAMRPQPLDAAARDRILATLPDEGDLQPNAKELVKLAGLEAVLRFHDRRDVYSLKVIDVPQATIGIHGRAVVLISRPALRVLTVKELQGLIAHEIGHEFFWDDYESARDRADFQALQEVELKSDGVAVVTMMALGLDPSSLLSAVRNLIRFNKAFGTAANVAAYPTLADRTHFVRRMIEGLKGQRRNN